MALNELNKPVRSVLFVCTGNIFRSLAAEYALKTLLGNPRAVIVGSAGIEAKSQPVHEWVRMKLQSKGADPSSHVQRQVNGEMIEAADLVIAMGWNHQKFLREQYGRDVPLFNQLCCDRDEPIPDVHEMMPDWEKDLVLARAYVWSVIDLIWTATPALIERLPSLRPQK